MRTFAPVLAVLLFLAATAGVARGDLDRAQPPPPGAAPAASFPEYQQRVLTNGLRVFVIEDHRTPAVTFRLLIKAGDACDESHSGLADATASLLNRGTTKRTAAEFAALTDFLGASVEGQSGLDSTELSASGLTKDLPKLLDLFSDAALHPTFPEDELARQKQQTISALEESKQRPATLAARLRGKLLYGADHPYGAYATEDTVNALTRADLVRFHDTYFSPDDATLAIVGDVTADQVMPSVEKAFADWKVASSLQQDRPKFPELPAPPKSLTIHLVDRPGSVQSNILVCRRGCARNDPDAPDLGVLNSILGGGFSGRLFQNLRERHGYTYGSSSSFAMNREAGTFSASAEVRNAVTVPALQEILNEIQRIDHEPVPEPELRMQRDYLAGNYLLSLESAERTAARVQEIDLYRLPLDYYKTYVSQVTQVSADQIKTLADRYLGADGWTVVVVGEAAEIQSQLEKLGPVIVYDTTLRAK